MKRSILPCFVSLLLASAALPAISLPATFLKAKADGIKDNSADGVRRIPPPGIEVSATDRAELQAGIAALGHEIEGLRAQWKDRLDLLDLLPDVIIYWNAARYALTYQEFFNPGEIGSARTELQQGMERARLLKAGQAPWNTATGLVVRGYVSKIDGSIQPYGLIVPVGYRPDSAVKHRLDLWFHGRGETLSEVNFLQDRQHSYGEFTPPDGFVLHPYGRYCNANKFAGEIDTLEALENVRKHYPIDENRIVDRGFSMGGAAAWHFAVHYAGDWVAAAPGAGFAETAEFLRVFQKETVKPTGWERKLWHLYDATDYALNLTNCPTVAYSGEKDTQKQAADIMSWSLAKEGITLTHIIGANAGHFYTREAKEEIDRRLDTIVAEGRNPVPNRVRFTTWTLRYNKMLWVTVDLMERHWERARVEAKIVDPGTVKVDTKNVAALTLEMPSGLCPLDNTHVPTVILDGQRVSAASVGSDRSWSVHFRRIGTRWSLVDTADDGVLRKRHGLQGPIDDAFMDRFLMVTPTGKAFSPETGRWCEAEQNHAVTQWRQQFRGEAPVKHDSEVTDADIADSNLVLWGDPSSNRVLARIAAKLPLKWDAAGIHVGGHTYESGRYVPVMIYPNPLNPKHYVVIDSGFTFREYDYLNNARQIPRLPDYAIFDTRVKATSRTPGGLIVAGFFDDLWHLPATIREESAGQAR